MKNLNKQSAKTLDELRLRLDSLPSWLPTETERTQPGAKRKWRNIKLKKKFQPEVKADKVKNKYKIFFPLANAQKSFKRLDKTMLIRRMMSDFQLNKFPKFKK